MWFLCNFTSHHCKIWHYNPAEEEEGVGSAYNPAPVRKNGFHLDSKEPDWSKLPPQGRQPQHRDLATPTLLHFGNAQAILALHSTSAAPIMGEVRYCQRLRTQLNKSNEVSNSLMKTLPSVTLLHLGKSSELALLSTSVMFPQEAEVPKAASTLE